MPFPWLRGLPPTLQRLLIVAVLVAAAIGGGLWYWQSLQRQRQAHDCQQLRAEIGRFKSQVFDARMTRMRKVRLNDDQTVTLRNVDPNAYARYATVYGQTVDQVAQAADQLADLVERYRVAACMEIR
ncbi:MAG: hypothetical protein VKK62_01435 [Synechococcaceae cyanobacterium]|nr:hypothetical protein [Synechococcaceae cyanobacterium]